jgi:hypothetical protein
VQTSVVNIKRSTAALAELRLFFVALPPDVRKAYGFPADCFLFSRGYASIFRRGAASQPEKY